MIKKLSILVLLFMTFVSKGQVEHMLEHFILIENGNSIILDWTIKEGNVCDGLKIYRSGDGENYEQIGEVFGVCGDITKPQNYTFEDNSPIANSYNYYRLELGFNGVSSPVSVYYIDMEGNSSLFAPNPCHDIGILHFDADGEVLIQIYNSKGEIVEELNSTGDSMEINLSVLPKGVYYYSIFGESKRFRGSIVKL